MAPSKLKIFMFSWKIQIQLAVIFIEAKMDSSDQEKISFLLLFSITFP